MQHDRPARKGLAVDFLESVGCVERGGMGLGMRDFCDHLLIPGLLLR